MSNRRLGGLKTWIIKRLLNEWLSITRLMTIRTHAFKHYIATFDVKQLTEAKWLVDPEYWLEKVITPDLVEQFYVDWLAELKTLQSNIEK